MVVGRVTGMVPSEYPADAIEVTVTFLIDNDR